MNELADTYTELVVDPDKVEAANGLNPIYTRELLGKKCYTFESVPRAQLEPLGECLTPTVADLFAAKLKKHSKEGGNE